MLPLCQKAYRARGSSSNSIMKKMQLSVPSCAVYYLTCLDDNTGKFTLANKLVQTRQKIPLKLNSSSAKTWIQCQFLYLIIVFCFRAEVLLALIMSFKELKLMSGNLNNLNNQLLSRSNGSNCGSYTQWCCS